MKSKYWILSNKSQHTMSFWCKRDDIKVKYMYQCFDAEMQCVSHGRAMRLRYIPLKGISIARSDFQCSVSQIKYKITSFGIIPGSWRYARHDRSTRVENLLHRAWVKISFWNELLFKQFVVCFGNIKTVEFVIIVLLLRHFICAIPL